MRNHLQGQTSPYLLQHAENPVDWYPWGQAAFEKAAAEDKPVFLSIGYSTCHWCHVMAHESFEDQEIAEILNQFFVSIKVDKEERPDIDSIYMAVCQAFTGGGGWPTSIFMTAGQKPFFAGTYFPKTARYGSIGLKELLLAVQDKWQNDRKALLHSANEIVDMINNRQPHPSDTDETLPERAVELYQQSFDERWGGFGPAPKFPTPHNLLFLMQHAQKHHDGNALQMAEKTLRQMYRGGIFDHIGYGFCRYSTDAYYLVPHFEKMLYDNALLILAYCRAYEMTGQPLYRQVAEKTASYLLSEMTSADGGFYSAQDADSDGEEGKYYVFTPEEIRNVLGDGGGAAFSAYYGITDRGNFEGKSIPNLLHAADFTDQFDKHLPALRHYRKSRTALHTDDKILTSWNSLMIAALCFLYRISQNSAYLQAAKRTRQFIEKNLCDGDALYVSWRNGQRNENGFLDDYACYIFALLSLYDVSFDRAYLFRAEELTQKAIRTFFDHNSGGFYLSGKENETLIFRPKESYDGAVPSGNSLMAYNLVRLNHLDLDEKTNEILQKQLHFMSGEAKEYPAGYAMFLMALSDYLEPPEIITVSRSHEDDDLKELPFVVSSSSIVRISDAEDGRYPLLNGQTAFYVCQNHSCLPPVTKQDFYEKYRVTHEGESLI